MTKQMAPKRKQPKAGSYALAVVGVISGTLGYREAAMRFKVSPSSVWRRVKWRISSMPLEAERPFFSNARGRRY